MLATCTMLAASNIPHSLYTYQFNNILQCFSDQIYTTTNGITWTWCSKVYVANVVTIAVYGIEHNNIIII